MPAVRVKFWGTRGSIPVALDAAALKERLASALVAASGHDVGTIEKARAWLERGPGSALGHTFGGDSPCVQLEAGAAEYVLCDLGTGARVFANRVLQRHGPASPQVFHVFMSHLHWDHIMGFPFFTPAYLPGNRIVIYGCHRDLEHAFRRQHAAPSFPVPFERLGARIEFVTLAPGRPYDIAGWSVTPRRQDHSGDSYGYRFERDRRSIVYSTDSEYKLDNAADAQAATAFFREADLVIFDAMYSLADSVSVKEDWGHSSNVVGVELCQLARAKHLVLFHHEPANSDDKIASIWRETVRFEEITRNGVPLRVSAAYDGLEIEL
ncbi:MAG TPA: MBL fold metallo-hydrolase [Burkholderiales bacterium]|nr:MBL fold metallo-hydrolase [Burkholderiales bacterium]